MRNPSLTKLKKLQEEAQALLDEREVIQEEKNLPPTRKLAHFVVRVYRSFVRNRCLARAAALAYTTVLGMVPLLAIVVAVSTSLLKRKGEKPIQLLIEKFVNTAAPMLQLSQSTDAASSAEAQDRVASQIFHYIGNVNTGSLTTGAVLALVFVAISMLSTIEMTFNDMWGVSQGRSWATRIIAYWAALTLGPLFLISAIGLTSAGQFETVKQWIENVPFLGTLVFHLLPYVILSLTFSLLYLLIPNTKVDWRAALVGGIAAGCLIQLNNVSSAIYLSRVTTYNRIYGSLSAVPLFLAGLYVSWVIVLLGAQVAYAFQNRKIYVQEKQAEAVNQQGREFVALRLMTQVALRFHTADRPPEAAQLADELGVPLRLTSQILGTLVETKLLAEAAGRQVGYLPARPLETITMHDVLQAMRAGHGQDLETYSDSARAIVRKEFESIREAERQTACTLTLKELVERVELPALSA